MEAISSLTKTKFKAIMQKRHCFAMNNKYILCLLFFLAHWPALLAQTTDKGRLSGKITNERGEALGGASIKVAGKSLTAVTDIHGNFSLDLDPGTYTLEI